MKIAFYAPMKPPDDPVPSGDRLMARQLMEAMRLAGHEVLVASRLRSFSHQPDAAHLKRLTGEADEAVRELVSRYDSQAERPDLWFTYHLHYKAPDLIGPRVAGTLGIPYVVAEASYARKRDATDWAPRQALVVDALRQASAIFCFTGVDRDGLETLGLARELLVDLPPFLAAMPPASRRAEPRTDDVPKFVTVAMMRPGKVDSYRHLARALACLADQAWQLTIVGDGPERATVEALFKLFGARIEFAGAQDAAGVADCLAAADVFLWPGIGEAYGLVYLEAAAHGLAAVAYRTAGVPFVVCHGSTGLLVEAGDVTQFATALLELMNDPPRRVRLGRQAHDFVRTERGLEHASACIDSVLKAVLARRRVI